MYKTRRLKKKIFKKTKKIRHSIGGNNIQSANQQPNIEQPNIEQPNIVPKEGIIDIAKNKTVDAMSDVGSYVGKKALRLFGLQPVNSDDQQSTNIIGNVSKIANEATSSIGKIANDTTSSIIQNINDVLETPYVNKTVQQSSEDTKEILNNLLTTFNNNLNDPNLKQEFAEATDNLADYTKIAVNSLDEPINETVDMLNKAGVKAISGISSGAIKVATDAAGAVPFVGPIIDLGKAVNDGSKAVSSVIEAGSEATEATSLLIGKTSENFKAGLEALNAKKMEAENILNRTNSSINKFQNFKIPSPKLPGTTLAPTQNMSGGKTKSAIKKQIKRKTHKVRFFI